MPDIRDLIKKPERPEAAPFVPLPAGRDVKPYAAKALADECAQVAAVPIGAGRNDQLNRSAFKMGTIIAAGAIDEHTVVEHLGAADGGLDYKATRDTIASGIAGGKLHPRNIPDRPTRELAPFEQSDDPLAPGYVVPESGTAAFTDSHQAAHGLDDAAVAGDPASTDPDVVRQHLPILDWHALWADQTEEEWIIEPILAARRQVAIYSAPKVGKSLLMLEIAQAVSRGEKVLGYQPKRPYRVLYVDFENDPLGDIRTRLRNMHVGPNDLDNLCYLSFPSLGTLDSERGSLELLAAVQVYGCEVVVIDTVSRAIAGEESASDTWLAFYRHTGLKLKQRGVALIRLDHSGKDETKGQRGSSAKSGDVDAVWRMSRLTPGGTSGPETFRLTNEATRMQISVGDRMLTLERLEDPLRTNVKAAGADDQIEDAIIEWMDEADKPVDLGFNKYDLAEVKQAVPGALSKHLRRAVARRKTVYGIQDPLAPDDD